VKGSRPQASAAGAKTPAAAVEGQPEDGRRLAEISHLYREHNRALVAFLGTRLKDSQAAREVAQEAYVKLLQLEQPGAVSFLRAYLFRVAGNLAIDRIRSEQTRARLDSGDAFDDFLEDSPAERAALVRDELVQLARILGELPDKYGRAFRLHRVQELGLGEIAALMGLKERTVREYVAATLVYVRLRCEGLGAAAAWRQIQS
jgi:RNA polymerase sigma factor (sigma-70 family)